MSNQNFYEIHEWNGTQKQLEDAWRALEDVPFEELEDGSVALAEDWFVFKKGADREEGVWDWFDCHHLKGVGYLMYEMEGQIK